MASPVWNKNVPQSSEFGSNWPQESQQNLEYLEETLALEHTFPGSIGPPQTAGKHNYATLGPLLSPYLTNPAALLSVLSRLKVVNNTGTPASKIDLSAAAIAVVDGTGDVQLLTSVAVTVDCTVVGANGLDAGSLATGWYYFYVIYNPTTQVAAGLASTSASAPTLPTDYTYYRLVSAVYYASTITYYNTDTTPIGFMLVVQQGNRVDYIGKKIDLYYITTTGINVASLAAFVPPNAIRVIMAMHRDRSGSLSQVISWDNAGAVNSVSGIIPGASGGNSVSTPPFKYRLNPSAPQTVYVEDSYPSYPGSGAFFNGYELDI